MIKFVFAVLSVFALLMPVSAYSDNPYGKGYTQTTNPYGKGYRQTTNPYGKGYRQPSGLYEGWE